MICGSSCSHSVDGSIDYTQADNEKPIWMNKRPKDGKNYRPTLIEDVANVLTHGVFILPCIWMGLMLYNLSMSQSQSFTAILYGG